MFIEAMVLPQAIQLMQELCPKKGRVMFREWQQMLCRQDVDTSLFLTILSCLLQPLLCLKQSIKTGSFALRLYRRSQIVKLYILVLVLCYCRGIFEDECRYDGGRHGNRFCLHEFGKNFLWRKLSLGGLLATLFSAHNVIDNLHAPNTQVKQQMEFNADISSDFSRIEVSRNLSKMCCLLARRLETLPGSQRWRKYVNQYHYDYHHIRLLVAFCVFSPMIT